MSEKNEAGGEKVVGEPFFPHHVLREAFVGCLVLGALILLATFLPAPLLEKADPFVTPSPIFPEWYFLPMFGFLKFWVWNIGPIPAKIIGIVAPGIAVGIAIILPFIDRSPAKHPLKRPISTSLGILMTAVAIYFAYYAIKISLIHAAGE